MRAIWTIPLLVPLALAASAKADLPDPMRSSFGVSGQSLGPCHFVFNADGGLDAMAVAVTLRDAFDSPVANCSTSVTLDFDDDPGSTWDSVCACTEPLRKWALSDAGGLADLSWSRLGGHGSLDVRVTIHCAGDIAVGEETFDFTSPDLNGSCEPSPAISTTVFDLGMWAAGMAVPWPFADYDCSGGPNTVVDLGVWASGLTGGC